MFDTEIIKELTIEEVNDLISKYKLDASAEVLFEDSETKKGYYDVIVISSVTSKEAMSIVNELINEEY